MEKAGQVGVHVTYVNIDISDIRFGNAPVNFILNETMEHDSKDFCLDFNGSFIYQYRYISEPIYMDVMIGDCPISDQGGEPEG